MRIHSKENGTGRKKGKLLLKGAAVAVAIAFIAMAVAAMIPSASDNDDVTLGAGEVSRITWARSFGGLGLDGVNSVAVAPDGSGFVAGGSAYVTGSDDWTGETSRGDVDAILIKYDNDGNVVWKAICGGAGSDWFVTTIALSDGSGYVAAGYSGGSSFGNGDWVGATARGMMDATIVKFDLDGNIVWARNFGGIDNDTYRELSELADGTIIAGGWAGMGAAGGAGTGDLSGMTSRGWYDSIFVNYDTDGNVLWSENFGGLGEDQFFAMTATSDGGFIAAGRTEGNSFGNGDWIGFTDKGGQCDATIVKFSSSGAVEWKYNFGASGLDGFNSVVELSDGSGYVAVGETEVYDDGDWAGVAPKGVTDALAVKFDTSGAIVWKHNFGGSTHDYFFWAVESPDGNIVTCGQSDVRNNGDWIGFTRKGPMDGTVVVYDTNGNVLEKYNFGGAGGDLFYGMIMAPDGEVVLAGHGEEETFDSGDWVGVQARGYLDCIVVKVKIGIRSVQVDYTGGGEFKFAFNDWGTQFTPVLNPAGGTYKIDILKGTVLLIEATPDTDFEVLIEDNKGFSGTTGSYSFDNITDSSLVVTITFTEVVPPIPPIPPIPPVPPITWLLMMLIGFGVVFFFLIFMDDDDEEEKK